MATISGTQGEKTDQLTQLFLAQQAQMRLMQWLGGVFLPMLGAFIIWLVLSVNSTKLEITSLQGDTKLLNQRFEQVNQRFEQVDKRLDKIEDRLGQLEKRVDQIDKRLDHLETQFSQLEQQVGQIDKRLDRLETQFGSMEKLLQKNKNAKLDGKLDKPKGG